MSLMDGNVNQGSKPPEYSMTQDGPRDELRKYAQHLPGCRFPEPDRPDDPGWPDGCSCGFLAAIERAAASPERVPPDEPSDKAVVAAAEEHFNYTKRCGHTIESYRRALRAAYAVDCALGRSPAGVRPEERRCERRRIVELQGRGVPVNDCECAECQAAFPERVYLGKHWIDVEPGAGIEYVRADVALRAQRGGDVGDDDEWPDNPRLPGDTEIIRGDPYMDDYWASKMLPDQQELDDMTDRLNHQKYPSPEALEAALGAWSPSQRITAYDLLRMKDALRAAYAVDFGDRVRAPGDPPEEEPR